ncbi:SH3-like domain-containing protein [Mesorhizobium sp. ASY16-5R]|uniref:SH3-like domain-containing protein n=1 Tax=Mesorhizobium sp. ASY16-5R TaxID=3445772 RepID=UPI003FA0DAB9
MSARFRIGDRVGVSTRRQAGHVRTPNYVKGKTGRILDVRGAFLNPELLAQGEPGLPRRYLYRVEFDWHEVWRDASTSSADRIIVDIYEHWLLPAESME